MLRYSVNKLNKLKREWTEVCHNEVYKKAKPNPNNGPSIVETKLLELKGQYNSSALQRYPPILFFHQLIEDDRRAAVEQAVELLRSKGQVMIFNLPVCSPPKAIVFVEDLKKWLQVRKKLNHKVDFFLKNILPKLKDMRVPKAMLTRLKVTDKDIKDLINLGLLVCTKESEYGLSLPCAGDYSRSFLRGRGAILSALNRSADKELLKLEMMKKDSLMQFMILGIDFHIADIIGLKIADRVHTTGGDLIRYLNAL